MFEILPIAVLLEETSNELDQNKSPESLETEKIEVSIAE
jgi:hypothetical protein